MGQHNLSERGGLWPLFKRYFIRLKTERIWDIYHDIDIWRKLLGNIPFPLCALLILSISSLPRARAGLWQTTPNEGQLTMRAHVASYIAHIHCLLLDAVYAAKKVFLLSPCGLFPRTVLNHWLAIGLFPHLMGKRNAVRSSSTYYPAAGASGRLNLAISPSETFQESLEQRPYREVVGWTFEWTKKSLIQLFANVRRNVWKNFD